jgi:hypothetical protein
MSNPETPDTEVSRYQNPDTKDWWRIMLEWGTGCQWLETITLDALERGEPWTIVTDLGSQTDAKEVMETHLMFKARHG